MKTKNEKVNIFDKAAGWPLPKMNSTVLFKELP